MSQNKPGLSLLNLGHTWQDHYSKTAAKKHKRGRVSNVKRTRRNYLKRLNSRIARLQAQGRHAEVLVMQKKAAGIITGILENGRAHIEGPRYRG